MPEQGGSPTLLLPEQGGSPTFLFEVEILMARLMPSILSVLKAAHSLHFCVEWRSGGICVGGLVSLSTVANRVFALLVLVLMILEKNVSLAFFKSKL